MKVLRKGILVITLILIISACATLDPQDIPKEEDLQEPEIFDPKLDYDIFQFRIDVDRNTYEKIDRNSERTSSGKFSASNTKKTEKSPYSYMGIYYGNGFFLDANQNLCIDVIKLLKLNELDYFRIIKNKNNAFDTYYECIKDGNEFTVITKDPVRKEINAVLEDGIITFNNPKEKLTIEEEAITYRPGTMLGNVMQQQIQKEGNLVKLAGRYVYELQTNDSDYNVGINNYLSLDDKLIFYYKNGKDDFLFKVMTTEDTSTYMQSEKSGFVVKRIDNSIKIKHNGKETTYNIELSKDE